jgi:hypothetical protein
MAIAACTNPIWNEKRTLGPVLDPSSASVAAAGAGAAPSSIDPPTIPSNLQVTLKNAADAHAELCSNDGAHPNFPNDADLITASFCQDLVPGGVMPTPRSLDDLLKQLHLDFKDRNGGNGVGGNPGFAILGHSSALTARKVSTLTPTAFVFTPPPADGSPPSGQYVILAFDPGEEFVEVASYDPTAQIMNFYVVFFEKDCDSSATGCTNVDLLTPNLTKGWSNLRVYEDTTSLGDTIFDCHVCHQPVDANQPFLRMQEIVSPFTHWFSASTAGGKALLADFHAAHGTAEDYGPIPAALIDKSDPALMAKLINQAGYKQPNAFDSQKIEAEVAAAAPGQPATNVPIGQSATWNALYEAAVQGKFIAPPYHDVKVTDPNKLAVATNAYKAWLAGAATFLPDIRDTFLADGCRDMGFAPKGGIDGETMLLQMCGQCHNSNLDMTQTREKFLVDAPMTRDEKDLAIQRINASNDDRLHMPPVLFRSVTAEEKQAMIDALSN